MIMEIQEAEFNQHFSAAFADLECGSKNTTR